MKNLLILFSILILNACASTDPVEANQTVLPSLKGKKILIVWGGWEGHQPDKYAIRMEKWLKAEGAEVTVSDSLGIYSDSVFMASLDLILPYWTMGTITQSQEKGLLTAVKNGAGIAGCHGGLGDSFRNNPYYQYMIGGQWVEHPGGDSLAHSIRITNSEDPITFGVPDFEILSEQYYMHIDPNVQVLATTKFDGKSHKWIDGAVMPVLWKKQYGKGRVFYFSVGHNPATFEVPEVWTILTRGIRWASESKDGKLELMVSPAY